MGSAIDTVADNPLPFVLGGAALAPVLFPAAAAGAAGGITGGLSAGALAPVTPATAAAVAGGASPAVGIGGLAGLGQLTRLPLGNLAGGFNPLDALGGLGGGQPSLNDPRLAGITPPAPPPLAPPGYDPNADLTMAASGGRGTSPDLYEPQASMIMPMEYIYGTPLEDPYADVIY